LAEIEQRLCLEMGLRGFGLNDQLGCIRSEEESVAKDHVWSNPETLPAPEEVHRANRANCRDLAE